MQVAKASTSGGSSADKTSETSPPTANIKPLATASPSVTLSSPRPPAVASAVCRTIPTASIRPLAPPSGVVAPRDAHSEGLVSSSTALPQATVTPTPATPSTFPSSTTATVVTLPTSTATTAAQLTPVAVTIHSSGSANTLTATVPPTPAAGSNLSSPSSGGATDAGPSNDIPAGGPSTEQSQAMDGVDEEAGADHLLSQAIALIAPNQEAALQPSAQKRKRDGDDQPTQEDENKRTRVELEMPSASAGDLSIADQQEAGNATSSSSLPADVHAMDVSRQVEDVILVDSDDDQAAEGDSNEVQNNSAEEREAEERHSQAKDEPTAIVSDVVEAPSESHEAVQATQQQPSSSSPGLRQSALILPTPSATNDRVGSSGEYLLALLCIVP